VIVDRPRSQTISAPGDVVLKCRATTDQSEASNLRIEWRRDGDVIRNITAGGDIAELGVVTDPRIVISDGGRQLRISQSQVTDTGRYTCHANNSIDSDTVTVQLTIRGSRSLSS
jgi:hypothetical protein